MPDCFVGDCVLSRGSVVADLLLDGECHFLLADDWNWKLVGRVGEEGTSPFFNSLEVLVTEVWVVGRGENFVHVLSKNLGDFCRLSYSFPLSVLEFVGEWLVLVAVVDGVEGAPELAVGHLKTVEASTEVLPLGCFEFLDLELDQRCESVEFSLVYA